MNLSPPRRMVDKCTPRDKYARTHIHLKSSFLQSSDDSSLSTPSSPWTHSYNARQRSQSSADTQGWKHLPTPIRPTFRPRDYASPPTADDVSSSSSSHTNTFKVLQRSLHNLDFDPTCLDRLDDQLLLSPTESFVDVCYSDAVHDEVPVPILQPIQPRIRNGTRLYDRTVISDEDPFHDWDENYSVKFKKPRQKRVPPPPLPKLPESPPRTSTQESMLALLESSFLYHNPNESVHFFPVPTQRRSVESRKSSFDAPSVTSTGSSSKFKRISDALTGRSREK